MDLGKLSQLTAKRVCVTCGAEFRPDTGKDGLTAMQKHVDHLMTHGSTPEQWAEAYRRIQEGKAAAKARA